MVGLVLAAVLLYAGYHAVRVGVRDGMREALEERRTAADDDGTHP